MKEITPEKIWRAYEKGSSYNDSIELSDNVKKNEDFYIGNQWEDVNAPDLEKPVFNFIKRVVNYLIAMLVTDDVAVQFTPMVNIPDAEMVCRILGKEVDKIFEDTKTKTRFREMLRNCAVDGDGAFYVYWDMDKGENGDPKLECIDNTKVLFGNPLEKEVDEQPYIIIVRRWNIKEYRERLEDTDFPKDKLGALTPDSVSEYYGEDKENDSTIITELVYMWKVRGADGKKTVHFTVTTHDTVIKPDTDTGYHRYPVCWMNWDIIKNSYHGQSPITGLIPNQIFVNKLLAMAMVHEKKMAFPKIVFDVTKIKKWTNKVGEAIGVVGDVNTAVADTTRAADMSTQVLQLVQKVVDYTRDFMGANDAALGNVNPENTSAIVAVQKATTAPLELQRMAFYQFVEDFVLVLKEMFRVNYGIRHITFYDDDGNLVETDFDFSAVDYDGIRMCIDVGSGSYFNELTQVATMDKLIQNGIIQDAILYLEGIPDKYIFNKQKIIEKLKVQQAQQQAMLTEQTMGDGEKNPQSYDPSQFLETTQEKIAEMV